MEQRSVTLLGATGSIGRQALEVIGRHPEAFRLQALAAGGGNLQLLASQAGLFRPEVVAVALSDAGPPLQQALRQQGGHQPEVLAGPGAVEQVAGLGSAVVLNAITGGVGLTATLAALAAGSTLALANKESLVVGGPLVRAACQQPGQIVPVDSEHSAIAQCLRGGRPEEVSRLILTASGGPFRGEKRSQLAGVTPDQALAHPTWSMGPVVTVNSATLVNKALELIEAVFLFGLPPSQIDVVVHPQSLIHSMVEFRDGSILAQVSPPDMRLPIALGLSWPERLGEVIEPLSFGIEQNWHFEPVDAVTFPAIELARQALASGPLHPAVLNAANEVAVQRFLSGQLSFLGIVETISQVIEGFAPRVHPDEPVSLDDVNQAQRWAKQQAMKAVESV
ncbi:MAG: 1-deoxy-D-xylulose-5-phosphate reductoisomerase [Micrococcales bacterium]|nr:1-deoxy-D-xylulose-5-phosphate reductoisomerase [Micrococcales bacterium]